MTKRWVQVDDEAVPFVPVYVEFPRIIYWEDGSQPSTVQSEAEIAELVGKKSGKGKKGWGCHMNGPFDSKLPTIDPSTGYPVEREPDHPAAYSTQR